MDSSFKVQVKNLGLIRSASIEFVPGLNVIQGPSSSGKSTLLNGITSTIFNDPGDGSITKGQSVSAVGIAYRGHKIIRKKDLNDKEHKTIYSVDGRGYGKIGRRPLQQVLDSFNLREVEITTDKVRVNFSSQFSTPFLVDEPPSKIYEFVTTTDDSVNLSGILHDMRSDLDQISTDKKVAEATVNSLKRVVAREREIASRADEFEVVFQKILDAKPRFEFFDKLSAQVIKTETAYKNALRVRDAAKSVYDAYNASSTTVLDEVMGQLEELNPTLSKAYALKKQVDSDKVEFDVVTSQYERLQAIPDVTQVFSLKTQSDRLSYLVDVASKHLEQGRSIKKSMQDAGQVDTLKDPGEALENLRNLCALISDIVRLDTEINSDDCELIELKEQIDDVERELSTFDVCPLCGQALLHHHK